MLLCLARNLYKTYLTSVSPCTVTVTSFTDSIFVIPLHIFHWTIWMASMTCLSTIYPFFFTSFNLLWWFNILHGCSICDRNTVITSMQQFQRKYFQSLPNLWSFDTKLFILSYFIIHPCYMITFGEYSDHSAID